MYDLLAAYLYPEKLTFSSSASGAASTYQPLMLAEYEMMESVCVEGRPPVWKHQSSADPRYLFRGTDGYWRIGPDYNAINGWIMSVDKDLSEIPQHGWKVTYGQNSWLLDPDLTVSITSSPNKTCST